MRIKNFEMLATTPLRHVALSIAEAGLEAIDTQKITRRNVNYSDGTLTAGTETLKDTDFNRLFVIGIGKCSLDAARAIEDELGGRIYAGIVIDVTEDKTLKRIKSYKGTYPYPSDKNVNYTRKIIELLSETKEDDLVLTIVSGGGSTFLCQPTNFLCTEEETIVKTLFQSGATNQEINTVRKHLSKARGGGLAKAAYPARVISLVFSDIPGNALGFIASGPTVFDSTTVADAAAVMEAYAIEAKCGFSPHDLIETPKDEKFFTQVTNTVVVSNDVALQAMTESAESYGYDARICTSCLAYEARATGKAIGNELAGEKSGSALFYGGETTVTLRGSGTGGRNQELALSALKSIADDEIIIALASDGRDNTDHAGAIVDAESKREAARRNLSPQTYLEENDSHTFFEEIDAFIETGVTGSNVGDLVIALKEK